MRQFLPECPLRMTLAVEKEGTVRSQDGAAPALGLIGPQHAQRAEVSAAAAALRSARHPCCCHCCAVWGPLR